MCECTILVQLALFFFFFNDTATTEIYTLSLHDALPICLFAPGLAVRGSDVLPDRGRKDRSEEHTSELQSRSDLVCRLLLEKKKVNHYRVDDLRTAGDGFDVSTKWMAQ